MLPPLMAAAAKKYDADDQRLLKLLHRGADRVRAIADQVHVVVARQRGLQLGRRGRERAQAAHLPLGRLTARCLLCALLQCEQLLLQLTQGRAIQILLPTNQAMM